MVFFWGREGKEQRTKGQDVDTVNCPIFGTFDRPKSPAVNIDNAESLKIYTNLRPDQT